MSVGQVLWTWILANKAVIATAILAGASPFVPAPFQPVLTALAGAFGANVGSKMAIKAHYARKAS